VDEHIEQWRPVAGFEGLYEVSDEGRVRSLDRTITCPGRWGPISYQRPGQILSTKQKRNPVHAYRLVELSRNGKAKTCQVHRLVLETFAGACPPGKQTRHLDGDLSNNRWRPGDEQETRLAGGNLIWGTPSENAYDRVRHRTHYQASKTDCTYGHKLDEPNLDPFWRKRGYRRCWACAATQMWGRSVGLAPGEPEWKAEADRRYAEILHFGQALNYRLAGNRGRRWTPGAPGPWTVMSTED
jgi:hypothetical protein